MTKYATVKIKDVLNPQLQNFLHSIRSDERISNAENNHCFIAGGFPRVLLELSNIKNNENHYHLNDVDIFLTSKTNKLAVFNDVNVKKSPFAANFKLKFSEKVRYKPIADNAKCEVPHEIPVQMIEHESLIKNSIYETLESFDFVNSKVAICNDEFILHSDWFETSRKKELRIENNNSPFLLRRVKKYSESYHYNNIKSDSIELINQWLVKAKENFENDCSFKNDKGLYSLYTSSVLRDIRTFVLQTMKTNKINVNDITNLLFYIGNFSVRKSNWKSYEKGRTWIQVDPIVDLFR